MVTRGRGTILFTGATGGIRGSANFAAFAGAKHALRALAQSMARELGPKNIHVAHIVVDGAIDTDFIRSNFRGAEVEPEISLAGERILGSGERILEFQLPGFGCAT